MTIGREIRVATQDDIPAILSVLTAHGNDGPVLYADFVGPYVGHLVNRHRAIL